MAPPCYMLLAEQLLARPERLRGQAFNFSNEIQVTVLELVNMILEEDGFLARAGRAERGVQRDSAPVSERGASAPDELGWAALHAGGRA